MRRRKLATLYGLILIVFMLLVVNVITISDIDRQKAKNEGLMQKSEQLESMLTNSQERVQELEKALEERKNEEASRGVTRPDILRSGTMIATAYGSHRMNGGAGTGKTYTGTTPVEGRTIAVDPVEIPIGSKVLIECKNRPDINGIYIAEDIGGDINGDRVDIYFDDLYDDPSHANKRMSIFGRKEITVHILK